MNIEFLHYLNLSILGYIHCSFCLNSQIIHRDIKENVSGCFFLNTVYCIMLIELTLLRHLSDNILFSVVSQYQGAGAQVPKRCPVAAYARTDSKSKCPCEATLSLTFFSDPLQTYQLYGGSRIIRRSAATRLGDTVSSTRLTPYRTLQRQSIDEIGESVTTFRPASNTYLFRLI